MAFGDELKGELSSKIGVTQSGDTFSQLEEGKKEKVAGNIEKANEIFKSIITQTNQTSNHLLSQKQHRAAAEQFYLQALSFEYMEKSDDRRISLSKTVEALQSASHTAINFGEDKRGITTLTLAGLVAVKYGDDVTAQAIYNQGISISDQKPHSESLKKLLYSLGYLLDALKNTNMSALTDAQGFIANDLKPMLNSSKLTIFNSLLDTIIDDVGKILESKVKMPKIEVMTQVPKDLLFGELYEVSIKIDNLGEGEATDLKLELEIPAELELVNSEATKTYEKIGTMASLDEKISFRMSGSGQQQVVSEITGNLTYVDMLSNTRKHIISPMELEFRSVSKDAEYKQKLENIYTSLIMDGLHEQLPASIVGSIKSLNESVKTTILQIIEKQDYTQADVGLDLMNSLVTWSNDTLKGNTPEPRLVVELNQLLYTREEAVTEQLTNQFKIEKETAIQEKTEQIKRELELGKQKLIEEKEFELEHQLREADKKFKDETAKLIVEHNNTVQDLGSKYQYEKEQAVNEKAESLLREFELEKVKLNEHLETEIGKLTRSHENKARLELTQIESKLKEEANVEIQKKNIEVEDAIRELQNQNVQELEKQAEKLRTELKTKYEGDIQELKAQLKGQEDRLIGHAVEEKESALKALENKLKQENDMNVENMRRELKDGYDHDISEQVSKAKIQFKKDVLEKDGKIRELQEKINIIESKQN